jgi:23S rRNA pseudouridine2605 synthase
MRLNKFLPAAGVAARRKADQMIKSGRVRVNGTITVEPWYDVDPERDAVTVDGYHVRSSLQKHYFKLYKPRGVTSTLQDRFADRTLEEFIPQDQRLFPVGRLDRESEGLIILTDDGELAQRLSHPRYGISKRYSVKLDRPLTTHDLKQLQKGLTLEDGSFRPFDLKLCAPSELELSLGEGRKREVRRGLRALGYRVIRLVRIAIGPIPLGNLRPGELRPLTREELEALRHETGLRFP